MRTEPPGSRRGGPAPGVFRLTGKGAPLHVKILLGLILGATAGILANRYWGGTSGLDRVVTLVAQPVGQVFLRMLFMIVIPLVITSLALGVAGLGDLRRLGRVGARTLGIFLATTTLAVLLGLAVANAVRPGDVIDGNARAEILAEFTDEAGTRLAAGAGFGVETLVAIVPRNPVDEDGPRRRRRVDLRGHGSVRV